MDRIGMALEFIKRLKAESPEFFKKIQAYSWVIFAVSGIAWLLRVFGVYELPVEVEGLLSKLMEYLTVGGGVAVLVASTPVKSRAEAGLPAEEKEPEPNGLVGGRPDDRKP
jgi:hypothetical protein